MPPPVDTLAYARTPLERAAAAIAAHEKGHGGGGGAANKAAAGATDESGIVGMAAALGASPEVAGAGGGPASALIAELERREAQARAAMANSEAQRWKAEAAAAERSRAATEDAAQSRAHVAVAEVARWKAEAEAADTARRAAENAARYGGLGGGGSSHNGSSADAAMRAHQGATGAGYLNGMGPPPPGAPAYSMHPPASAASLPQPAGPTSAEAVAAQVMQQINSAAEQLKIAEERANAVGPTHAADGSVLGAVAMPAQAAGDATEYSFSCCASSPLSTPAVACSGADSPGAFAPLSPLPPPSGRMDAELTRIDAEIEHLQAALEKATSAP